MLSLMLEIKLDGAGVFSASAVCLVWILVNHIIEKGDKKSIQNNGFFINFPSIRISFYCFIQDAVFFGKKLDVSSSILQKAVS